MFLALFTIYRYNRGRKIFMRFDFMMKQFLKDNIYHSVRMLINQLVMTMFSLMLIFSVSTWGDQSNAGAALNDGLLVGVSALSILFYLYLIYYMTFELGQKDGIRIESGRMRPMPWKGFWIALIANVPNLIMGLLELIGKIAIQGPSIFMDVSMQTTVSPEWAVGLFNTCHTLARFGQGMYIGIGSVWFRSVGFYDLLIPIPAILVGAFSYMLGVKYCNGFFKTISKKDKKGSSARYQ